MLCKLFKLEWTHLLWKTILDILVFNYDRTSLADAVRKYKDILATLKTKGYNLQSVENTGI